MLNRFQTTTINNDKGNFTWAWVTANLCSVVHLCLALTGLGSGPGKACSVSPSVLQWLIF